jgi:hypothetical protein
MELGLNHFGEVGAIFGINFPPSRKEWGRAPDEPARPLAMRRRAIPPYILGGTDSLSPAHFEKGRVAASSNATFKAG